MKKTARITPHHRYIVILWTVLSLSCAGSNANVEDPDIPNTVQEQADAYIAANLGENFFVNYVTLNTETNQYSAGCAECSGATAYLHDPHYVMHYTFSFPEMPDVLIQFYLDTDGNFVTEAPVIGGFPDCITLPTECDFSIDEDAALSIAQTEGLSEGISEWNTTFYWDTSYSTYAWFIESEISESEGEIMILDANSGEVLHVETQSHAID